MSDLIVRNAKYSDWKESHTFENCKLNRKEYGEFLADYITGEYNGFVLNLNGAWGTGKTEFLKRFYTELLNRNHPVVYVDAWESDFSQDPLTVVTSELLTQLEAFNEGIGNQTATQKVKELCGKALKGAAVGLAGITTAKLLNDSNVGMETVKQLLEKGDATFTKQLTEDYAEQVQAIRDIREQLGILGEVLRDTFNADLPVVVLVDELDRCRPTYSIEMLEVIKHFFTTENFVFVVATDTEQLCHSITAVYGDSFDSQQYLKRFFDRKASLPEPDLEHYINATGKDYSQYSSELRLFPSVNGPRLTSNEEINMFIASLAKAYDLKVRDVDQLVSKIHSCLRTVCSVKNKTGREQLLNFVALTVGLIEQDKEFKSYLERGIYQNAITEPTGRTEGIDSKLSLNLFIALSMRCTVLTRRIDTDHFERQIVFESLPNNIELNNSLGSGGNMTAKSMNFIDTLAAHTSTYNREKQSSQFKFWLWADLKRVIELAGNLE